MKNVLLLMTEKCGCYKVDWIRVCLEKQDIKKKYFLRWLITKYLNGFLKCNFRLDYDQFCIKNLFNFLQKIHFSFNNSWSIFLYFKAEYYLSFHNKNWNIKYIS